VDLKNGLKMVYLEYLQGLWAGLKKYKFWLEQNFFQKIFCFKTFSTLEQIFHLSTLKSLTPNTDRCKAYGNDQIHRLSCWFQINYENTLKSWSHFKNLVVAYNKSSSDELISLALSLERLKEFTYFFKHTRLRLLLLMIAKEPLAYIITYILIQGLCWMSRQ